MDRDSEEKKYEVMVKLDAAAAAAALDCKKTVHLIFSMNHRHISGSTT